VQQIFFSHLLLWFYHSTLFFLNIGFMVIFNFIYNSLSQSHDVGHVFCMPFLNKGFFFLKCFVCIWFFKKFFIFYVDEMYFIKKIIYFEIIFIIYLALHFFPFVIFNQLFHVCFCYLLLIVIKKFIRHKQVNISFCEIKYLDLHPSLNFFNFSISYS